MPTKRSDRVGALIQAALSELILRGVKDPRVGMVTVTGVDVSPDLKHAQVFVAAHGDAASQARTLTGLASARVYLQSQVGRKLGLRFTPELRFALDESLDRADRMDRLLRELHSNAAGAGEPDPGGGEPDRAGGGASGAAGGGAAGTRSRDGDGES